MNVNKSYKFRLYPNTEQKETLSKTFGCTRFVYNYMLRLRTDAWYERQEKIGYHETSCMLTKLKKDEKFCWLNDVASVPLQQSLRNLQTAFSNFFAKRTSYPTFKNKHSKQSAKYTIGAFKWGGAEFTVARIKGPLKIKFSRTIPESANITSCTISKDKADRYFVSLLYSEESRELPRTTNQIGIDLGLINFVTLSTGEKISAPNTLRNNEKKLAKLQRRLAKKKRGSANFSKAKHKVAKMYATITDKRKDFSHKLSTRLIRENQTIAVETLSIKNMQRNKCLSKSISDASWGEFLRQLEYKAKWYGRTLVSIDKWYPSSKRCSSCGFIVSKLPLSTRSWTCPECGSILDRDVNASLNIKAAGLAALALGESVIPT